MAWSTRRAFAIVIASVFACACSTSTDGRRRGGPLPRYPSYGDVKAPGAARPIYYTEKGEFWRVAPDGTGAQKLGVKVDDSYGGVDRVGSTTPILSPDGARLAFIRKCDVWVAATVDPAKPQRLTQYGPGQQTMCALDVYLSGWSPDSQFLLFNVAAEVHEDAEDGQQVDWPELPKDVKLGFFLYTPADGLIRHLPKLSGFQAFKPDSRHVIDTEKNYKSLKQPAGVLEARLMETDLITGDTRTLQEWNGKGLEPWMQFELYENDIIWNEDGQILRARLDGSGRTAMTDKAGFAMIQRSRISPDGNRLAYMRMSGMDSDNPITVVEVVDTAGGGKPTALAKCSGRWSFRWHDASRIVLNSADGIRLLDMAGKGVSLASKDAKLVVVGAD